MYHLQDHFIYSDPARDYPRLKAAVLFLGTVQLTYLGIIDECPNWMLKETKGDPLYFVNANQPATLTDNACSPVRETIR